MLVGGVFILLVRFGVVAWLVGGVFILLVRFAVVARLQYFSFGPLIYLQSGGKQSACDSFLHFNVVPTDDRFFVFTEDGFFVFTEDGFFVFTEDTFLQYFSFGPLIYLQLGGKHLLSSTL
jgi:hypothetical protein